MCLVILFEEGVEEVCVEVASAVWGMGVHCIIVSTHQGGSVLVDTHSKFAEGSLAQTITSHQRVSFWLHLYLPAPLKSLRDDHAHSLNFLFLHRFPHQIGQAHWEQEFEQCRHDME